MTRCLHHILLTHHYECTVAVVDSRERCTEWIFVVTPLVALYGTNLRR